MKLVHTLIIVAAFACGAAGLHAQVGPTTADAARYEGLHAAANRGDVAQIERLVATKMA